MPIRYLNELSPSVDLAAAVSPAYVFCSAGSVSPALGIPGVQMVLRRFLGYIAENLK